MFNWFSFLTYAIVTAVTPGPNNILSMSNGSRKGFRGALPFNMGIWAGFSAVMLLCTAFCSLLSAWIPKMRLPMLIVGSLYMLYLAWETFRSSGVIEEKAEKDGFFAGLLLQFVNPKIYIYCIASMEAYILPFYQGRRFRSLASHCCWRSSALPLRCCGRRSARCSSGCFRGTPRRSTPSWRCSLYTAPCRCFCNVIKEMLEGVLTCRRGGVSPPAEQRLNGRGNPSPTRFICRH